MIQHALGIALYALAAFFGLGGLWFACGAHACRDRRARAILTAAGILTAVIVAVLAAAGWELTR